VLLAEWVSLRDCVEGTHMPSDEHLDWDAIVGRALAFLCLHYGGLRDKALVDQADFLFRLGLPRKEAALLLGTNDDSLSAMIRQRSKKTGTKPGAAKKAGAARKAAKSRGN
jgi:hypothetical protein